jgi:hypothetical protein
MTIEPASYPRHRRDPREHPALVTEVWAISPEGCANDGRSQETRAMGEAFTYVLDAFQVEAAYELEQSGVDTSKIWFVFRRSIPVAGDRQPVLSHEPPSQPLTAETPEDEGRRRLRCGTHAASSSCDWNGQP